MDRIGSVKTLYELHIHYKHLVTRVYYHARCTEYCKKFSVALKMIYAIGMVWFSVSYDSANKQKHHKSHRMQ